MFKTYSSSSSLVITSHWFATSCLAWPASVRLVYWLIFVGNWVGQDPIYVHPLAHLTHWGRVTHICVSWLCHHWFRYCLVAWPAPSHYLNQCWDIVYWTLSKKHQWNFNRNSNIFCEMAAILSTGIWVNFIPLPLMHGPIMFVLTQSYPCDTWFFCCTLPISKQSGTLRELAVSAQSWSTAVLSINHVIQMPQCLSGFMNHDYSLKPYSNTGQIRSNWISHLFTLNTNFPGHQFLVENQC